MEGNDVGIRIAGRIFSGPIAFRRESDTTQRGGGGGGRSALEKTAAIERDGGGLSFPEVGWHTFELS
jgi:hypothetical protein